VYVAFTMRYIDLSAAARKRVNELDAQTSGKAVDALLNYETARFPVAFGADVVGDCVCSVTSVCQ
jgi:ABC-type transport system involved in Fe-S cluster assembly fused permease/ATPase subunit